MIEKLNFAVVGMFSYGWPELEEIRIQVPKQCGIKGDYKVGLFRRRHILMRFELLEDFITMTSKAAHYINSRDDFSYQIRPLIYDPKFKIDKETTMAMAWISFPNLLPTYFVKEYLFTLASTVGKPLQLDMTTINKTRPSCDSLIGLKY
ncbi:hypothetical protein K7X08_038044 [Anisodus acutangulus]|uniref:DUF4283 domain-containing protein n=1 Tax=Anisodus acutangulus TaxID=402998 RepID=A0A9Q1MY29_9SOLA|nr:hypothetical protein K7X08_038044 [Anisodus acutangulus]